MHRGEFVTPAGEWLLDNFHLVASEIRDVRQNLPRGYYRELPKLASRELAGNARVYALAVELIRHSDSRLDRAQLVRFLDAFQTVAPLTIGELWAWPSMLKLALVENLRGSRRRCSSRAPPGAPPTATQRRSAPAGGRAAPALPRAHTAFIVQLLQRMREYGPRLSAVRGLDAHLAAERTTAEERIRSEHQREAAAQVSVANLVASLRLCSTLDWSEYVESVSLVERVLQRDPAGVHARMDFLSRDRYRQAVEQLADRTGEAQVRVALRAVESARQVAEEEGPSARAAHVGHHLIGKGRRELEADVAWRPGVAMRLRRFAFAHATAAYLGAIALATTALLGAGAGYVRHEGGSRWAQVVVALLLARARERARDRGRPAHRRALAPPRRCRASISRPGSPTMRGRWWSCRRCSPTSRGSRRCSSASRSSRSGTSIPASTSRCSATSRTPRRAICPGTRPSSMRPASGIEALNARLGEGRGDRFFLLHRARQWNPRERTWMGWERKRGKLEELNRLLRGATDTSFDVAGGRDRRPRAVRYCITLDSGHAPAARRGEEAHRHHRAPAQPAPRRPELRPGHRRLRDPAAARQRHHGERRRVDLRADLRRAHRRGPVHHRRSRTPTRTSSARAASRARGSTTSTRSRRRSTAGSPTTRSSRTTSSRASTRAPAS